MAEITNLLEQVDSVLWGPWMVGLLLGTGCYLQIRLKGLPLRRLLFSLRCVVGLKEPTSFPTTDKTTSDTARGISPLASLTTELAATIGTGNIVGVATAMVLGGPGALVWMILSAFVGMSTKLVESMLSVKYRSVNEFGEYVGGPMITLERAFAKRGRLPGKLGRVLAVCFSVFAVLASFGMGNMTQANSVAAALEEGFCIPATTTGLILTILTILVVVGGIRGIAKCTQVLVPAMGILYLAGALFVIAKHAGQIPAAVAEMFGMAFSKEAIGGGLAGSIIVSGREALRFGVSRGVFSNEAGLGAAGISAVCADTADYVRQGYISMTGVFFDTIIICSVTGISFLTSGVLGSLGGNGMLLTGTTLANAAFRTAFGEYGSVFISICITLFAFATIASWAYQGEKAFEYLFGGVKARPIYRVLYSLVTFLGAVYPLEAVWNFADICNGFMAVPNLICILVLAPEACREICESK